MYKKSRFYTLTPLPTNFSLCVITAVKNQRISWQNRVAIRSFWNFIPKIKWFDHFFALLNIEENKTLTKTLNSCDLVYKKWASNLAAVTYNLAFKRMMWWRWPSSWPSTPSSPTRTRSSTTLKSLHTWDSNPTQILSTDQTNSIQQKQVLIIFLAYKVNKN